MYLCFYLGFVVATRAMEFLALIFGIVCMTTTGLWFFLEIEKFQLVFMIVTLVSGFLSGKVLASYTSKEASVWFCSASVYCFFVRVSRNHHVRLSVKMSCKCNSSLTEESILIKLYTGEL